MTRVGMLLSGCGRYDGTEIHEAVLALLALDRMNARVECFAPSSARAAAVDHATGEQTEDETRLVLTESARISRGRITPIREARTSLLAALLIPGGQGVARTLMIGVGEPGRKREADPEVATLVKAFIEQHKPIGTISLAGTLTSTILGLPLEENPFSTPAHEVRIDEEHGIVWTPGFLTSDSVSEVARGIDGMVAEVLRRAAKGLTVVG